MRRKIALMLALVMILSLIPMASFAASSNRVTNVVQAEADEALTVETDLVIEDNKLDLAGDQTFRLKLENAEWVNPADMTAAVNAEASITVGSAIRLSSTEIQLTVEFDANETEEDPDFVLALKDLISKVVDTGDARITVVPLDSAVSGSTHTFATVVDGDTVTNVSKTVTFGPEEPTKLGNFIIDETVAGVLYAGDKLELTLPRDFDFGTDGLAVNTFGGFSGSIPNSAVDVDGRDVVITLPSSFAKSTTRGTIVIEGLTIESDSSRFGDVDVRVGGDLTSQTFKVAEYADFSAVVEADGDIKEIIAGRFDDKTEGEGFALTTMLFEEKIADSIVRDRTVTVEFPDWVKITAIDITGLGTGDVFVEADWIGDNEFEFEPVDSDKIEYEIDVDVVVEADAEGDIVAVVSGRGLEEDYEVVLGTAVPPVTVDMEMTEVVVGSSSQMLADITITENAVGALIEGEWLKVIFDIDDLRLQSGVEVTVDEDSELEIDDVERDVNELWIEIDRESDEAGVIEITALMASLNRIPATGDYDVLVGGGALVNNNYAYYEENYTGASASMISEANWDWFEADYVWEAPMLRVVTEASQADVDVAFTVGMNAYMVEGEVMTMDVAPFIADGRLMIPVRYLEELFGMQPIWNATSRTVTVLYNGMVYEMAIGSAVLRVNGAPFMEMDAEAQIVDGRTFVPASRFARAMGIEYSWDPATQTVTFMK